MPVYKNIPVDEETHDRLVALCQAYELGQRGKGALVRKLVKAEYDKLDKAKLLPKEGKKTEKQVA